MELKTFKTLEERVESLLNDYSNLRTLNRKIDEELEKKRLESFELSRKIEKTEEVNGQIRDKVDHLLERIEAFKESLR